MSFRSTSKPLSSSRRSASSRRSPTTFGTVFASTVSPRLAKYHDAASPPSTSSNSKSSHGQNGRGRGGGTVSTCSSVVRVAAADRRRGQNLAISRASYPREAPLLTPATGPQERRDRLAAASLGGWRTVISSGGSFRRVR